MAEDHLIAEGRGRDQLSVTDVQQLPSSSPCVKDNSPRMRSPRREAKS